jgi:membrane fusion protein, multidrug efflux system
VDIIVPSNWVRWLKPGTPFSFRVDEVRRDVPAAVVRVGAAVDAVSQTIKIAAKLLQSSDGILPGMSGSASFDVPDWQ